MKAAFALEPSNEQLLLTALDGSGWLAALACRIVDGAAAKLQALDRRFGDRVPDPWGSSVMRHAPVTVERFHIAWTRLAAVLLLAALCACDKRQEAQVINVQLADSTTFTRRFAIGDEMAPEIVAQANHYRVSEIRRSGSFDYVDYVYQAAKGFVGSDETTIEVRDGCCGLTEPRLISRVVIRFVVHE